MSKFYTSKGSLLTIIKLIKFGDQRDHIHFQKNTAPIQLRTYAYSSTSSITMHFFQNQHADGSIISEGVANDSPISIDEVGLPSARLLLIEKFIIHRYYFRKGGGEEGNVWFSTKPEINGARRLMQLHQLVDTRFIHMRIFFLTRQSVGNLWSFYSRHCRSNRLMQPAGFKYFIRITHRGATNCRDPRARAQKKKNKNTPNEPVAP